ncbi:MAG: oligosaccharide flippase family protein, partial [Actinomycetota bacterium]
MTARAVGKRELKGDDVTNTEADQSGADPAEGTEAGEHQAARQSLGRNVVTTLAAQVISWSSALVVVTMLPRYLGPERVGQLRVATAIWLVAGGFIIFGTDKTITLQIARSEDEIARIVASAIRLRLLLWAVAAIVIALSLTVLQVDPTLGILAAIVGTGAIGTVVGSVGISSLQGLENFGSLAKVTSTMSVISLVSVVTAISLDVGLIPIACLLVMGEFINGALQFYFLRRFARLRWRTTWANVRATARRGLPYLLGGVALILYREADTMVMATLVDDEQIGWYTTADRLFGTALVVPTVLMTTMLPVLARVH